MPTKTVTVREIYDAIEKNGLEHIRGAWFDDNHYPKGACILGQGAVNLGVSDFSIRNALDQFKVPLSDIPRRYLGDEDNEDFTGIGTILIWMNDVYNIRHRKNPSNIRMITYFHYSYTWKQLIAAAYKFLSPHFDEQVEVEVWTFGF